MKKEIQRISETQLMKHYPNGERVLAIYNESDELTREIIMSGRFELEKYDLINSVNWPEKFALMNVNDVEQAIKIPTPSIASIRKYKGTDMSIAFLVKVLEEIDQFFNVTNGLNDLQRLMTAKIIYKKFYFLTIADFRLCLINAYSGKYGKVFNRIDGAVVMDWFEQYLDERHAVSQTISQRYSDRLKTEPGAHEIDREGIEKMIEIFKTVKDKKRRTKEKMHFKTVEHYFNHRELDVHQCQCRLWELWLHEFNEVVQRKMFDGEFTLFFRWKLNGLMYHINQGKHIENILAS